MGEAFSINLSSGQGTYVYQMPLPDGVAAHTPKLTLEYAHGAGHGAWGLGWRMGLRSISRRLDFGTPDESLVERFLDSGSEIVRVTDSSYRAVRESAFSRYENRNGGWRIEDRNGLVHELGTVPEARVADANHPERVIEWLLERTLDVSGNAIHYRYRRENGFAYLLTIRYAIYEVRFRYQDRPDRRWDGRAGFLRRRTLRCAGIDLFLDPGPAERRIRSWDFGYVLAEGSGVSLLSQVVLTSHGPTADGTGDVRRPPIQFQYTSFDPKQYRVQWMDSEGAPPPGLEEPDVALVSMDDAPLPGILINRGGSEYYWPNRGNGRWGMPQPVRSAPATASFARAGVAFVDMDGSGDADLLVTADDQGHGYYENRRRQGWGGFVAFPRNRRNSPPWTDPTLRLLDADGNGVVDAMTSQRRAFVWWRNGGRNGWDDPALIPKSDPDLLQVDLNDPDIHLADMTGDGLPDIVRVRSGSVEYWPNLGRGRFGQRILMRQAPRIRRTPNDALLLVDLDGDGCAELVHWFRDGLVICQNRNGEQFAEPVLIQGLPEPIAGTVRAMNLEGQAGAGLVWNSHTWQGPRYVQFSFRNAVPPYVLSLIENGAALLRALYRSAVEDYLRTARRDSPGRRIFRFFTSSSPARKKSIWSPDASVKLV
ncbi:MAG: SpvB/TcaC N-terminal domain-containing protein [Verrucomicrobiota bacterium]